VQTHEHFLFPWAVQIEQDLVDSIETEDAWVTHDPKHTYWKACVWEQACNWKWLFYTV